MTSETRDSSGPQLQIEGTHSPPSHPSSHSLSSTNQQRNDSDTPVDPNIDKHVMKMSNALERQVDSATPYEVTPRRGLLRLGYSSDLAHYFLLIIKPLTDVDTIHEMMARWHWGNWVITRETERKE
ncbi:hypothetical protein C1H76_0280 [Elsinoe australis]|uniref:Uncharacterized protein n=1 Tax=Elsinoe australis TaxID=40998 RepID=A0A4U7B7H2_9PEZI|nr:hypothetical protein C1H76_0280 [Elsinoe australis]